MFNAYCYNPVFFIIILSYFIFYKNNTKMMMKNKWKNEWRIIWNLGQDSINWKFGDLIKL